MTYIEFRTPYRHLQLLVQKHFFRCFHLEDRKVVAELLL